MLCSNLPNPLCSELQGWAHRSTMIPSQRQILLDTAIPPEGVHSANDSQSEHDMINKAP